MLKYYYYYSILILFFLRIGYSQSITLNDAISLALENNYKIKQYEEKYEQRKFDELTALGNFLPTLNLGWSYNHLNKEILIDLDPIKDVIVQLQASNQVEFTNVYNLLQGKTPLTMEQRLNLLNSSKQQLYSLIPSFKETMKKQDYKSSSFIGVMPLFMGGKLLAAKKYSTLEKESANLELSKVKNEVLYEVINSYLNCVLLSEIVKLREDVLELMIKHNNKATKLFNEGIIAQNQKMRAEVAVAEAEKNLTTSKNNLEVALMALKNLLNYNQPIIIDLKLKYLEFNISLDSLLEYSLNNQELIKILELKQNSADQKYNIELSNFLPQIYAFGKYEIYPEYLSTLEPRWTIGIQANINLFNGFKDYTKLQSASHLKKEIEYLKLDSKNKIELWVKKSYAEIINSKEKYLKQESNINLALENLRVNDKRFETGMGTSLDVIDAAINLEKNQLDRIISLYEYYKNINGLLLAKGKVSDFLILWNSEG